MLVVAQVVSVDGLIRVIPAGDMGEIKHRSL